MITYQVDNWDNVKNSILGMVNNHWKEIEDYQDELPIDLDLDMYHMLNQAGYLKVIIVKDKDKIIGYHILIINKCLHYKNKLMAATDMFYLNPDYRKGFNGIKLFKFTEKVMVKENVKLLLYSSKYNYNKGIIFKRLGFQPAEISYSKLINKKLCQ